MSTPPFKTSLPLQKHPFDEKGTVLVNKEWYLALLGIYKQVAANAANSISVTMTDEKGIAGTYGFSEGTDFIGGTTTFLTLSQAYSLEACLWVSFDGTPQGPDQFSLSGKILTFTSAIPEGVSKVYVKGILISIL